MGYCKLFDGLYAHRNEMTSESAVAMYMVKSACSVGNFILCCTLIYEQK